MVVQVEEKSRMRHFLESFGHLFDQSLKILDQD